MPPDPVASQDAFESDVHKCLWYVLAWIRALSHVAIFKVGIAFDPTHRWTNRECVRQSAPTSNRAPWAVAMAAAMRNKSDGAPTGEPLELKARAKTATAGTRKETARAMREAARRGDKKATDERRKKAIMTGRSRWRQRRRGGEQAEKDKEMTGAGEERKGDMHRGRHVRRQEVK